MRLSTIYLNRSTKIPMRSWIAELELSDWEEDRELLLDGAAYAADVERKAAED